MKAFYAEEQKRHEPKAYLSSGTARPHPEKPARVEILLAGASSAGLTIERPRNHVLGPITAVHTPEYLDFLEHISRAGSASKAPWQKLSEYPSDHPQRLLPRFGGRPGRLSYGRHRVPDLDRDLEQFGQSALGQQVLPLLNNSFWTSSASASE